MSNYDNELNWAEHGKFLDKITNIIYIIWNEALHQHLHHTVRIII